MMVIKVYMIGLMFIIISDVYFDMFTKVWIFPITHIKKPPSIFYPAPELTSEMLISFLTEQKITRPSTTYPSNFQWQRVIGGGAELYLKSAFLDDRNVVLSVRIIGIAEVTLSHLVCLLWYRKRENPFVAYARYEWTSHVVSGYETKNFRSVLVTCEVSTDFPPEGVSVHTHDSMVPLNYLKLRLPVQNFGLYKMCTCAMGNFKTNSSKVTVYIYGPAASTKDKMEDKTDTASVDYRTILGAFDYGGFYKEVLGSDASFVDLYTSVAFSECMYEKMFVCEKILFAKSRPSQQMKTICMTKTISHVPHDLSVLNNVD